MPVPFNPGRLIVDEASGFGASILPGSVTASPPDPQQWQTAMLGWLADLASTAGGRAVGPTLLQHLGARRGTAAAVEVRLTTYPRDDAQRDEAWTNTQPGSSPFCTPGVTTVFVSYTPPNARGRPTQGDPMKHPLPILAHELLHALMNVHGVNTLIDNTGIQRPIAGWSVAGVYPSFNEFLATAVQNMVLSERGLVLRDGYTGDDPWIDSHQAVPLAAGDGGVRAAPGAGVDLARFVAAYRPPLDYLMSALPQFTQALAALGGVPFNPFREITRQRAAAAGARRRTGAPQGSSRVPPRP
jgi:hypothetical protein